MMFTLVYQGDLPPNGSAFDKWRIRRELEPQIRRLSETPPFESLKRFYDPADGLPGRYVGRHLGGIGCVPLISSKVDLRAKLDVLLLSSDMPGGLLHAGDIDNRLKTLFDALSMPANAQQVPTSDDAEPDGRLFCLLEDDRLVTRVEVSNDRLLTELPGSRRTLVLIRVQPHVAKLTMANLEVAV
jgi:hypothetical protein